VFDGDQAEGGGDPAPHEACNTDGTDEVFDGDQAEGGGDPAPEDDTGYSQLALMMASFLQTLGKDMRGMQKKVSQLRQELRSAPAPLVEVSSPDPPMHVVLAEVLVAVSAPAPADPLVLHLATLRQDQVLAQQAERLVDSLDGSLAGQNMGRYLKYGWAHCGGELAPHVPTPWPQDYIISEGKSTKVYCDDLNLFKWTQGQ
jgi:hypothetical protein